MKNIEQTADKKPRPRSPITVIVEREFIGDKTLAEAFIPVIVEDLRNKTEQARTLDNNAASS